MATGVRSNGYRIERFTEAEIISPSLDSMTRFVTPASLEANAFAQLSRGQALVRVKDRQGRYRLYIASLGNRAFERSVGYFLPPAAVEHDSLLTYRFFSRSLAAPVEDLAFLAFDDRRIYAWDTDSLFLHHDSTWIALSRSEPPRGGLFVSSRPPEARILIDGQETGKTAPATFQQLSAGVHTVSASIPEYLFSRSRAVILPDTTISLSFALHAPMDTAFVKGDLDLGVLVLPRPPIATPYRIDGRVVDKLEVSLNAGKHRVVWEGGNRYSSLDTVVDIFPARVSTFDFSPRRRTGILDIATFPSDAEIYIDSALAGRGPLRVELPTEAYAIDVKRQRYYATSRTAVVAPDSVVSLAISLDRIPDRDQDGFLDSADVCPDVYGLYGGCPKAPWRETVKLNVKRVLRNMIADPFAFAFNAAGYLTRRATNDRFRQILTYFADGPRLLNNQNGLTGGNVVSASYRGACARLELGQWNNGLSYLKPDTLRLDARDGRYLAVYDSLAGFEPRVIIPSTSFALGVHFTTDWFNVSYLIGRQWEDIIVSDLLRERDMTSTSIVFDNDWWFHVIDLELELRFKEVLVPTVYTSFAFPLTTRSRTGWHTLQAGMRFKFVPSLGKGKPGRARKKIRKKDT
jgi:hypothetical protein